MKRRFYLQLGRAGDILNILPLCLRDFQASGLRPLLMVQADYASLLDGVSYVEPVIWSGRFTEIGPAYVLAERIAKKQNAALFCTQIYAEGLTAREDCSSFLRQSWANVPDAPAWGSLPLIFDRRSPDQEQLVTDHLRRGSTKHYIVIALDGVSSPFAHAMELAARLRGMLKEHGCDIINISGFRAPRLFDLLGLLEGARVIVTVDSGILHLAHAVPQVPVMAFITRDPSRWHGSAWRPQHRMRFYYDECPQCFAELLAPTAPPPRILHVFTSIEVGISDETRRRNDFAASTWAPEYALAEWVKIPFSESNLARSSADEPICDERPIPFMHDVINQACDEAARPTDIIAWTNADSCFTPGITGWILDTVPRHGAAYTHRWDFHCVLDRPLANEAQVRRGEWYPGTDACFFTVAWWRAHRHGYPDMLVGREQNDEVLRQLIKARGGVEIPAAIYHEKHPSFWEHHGRRMNGHGNQWNHRLAKQWFLKMGYRPFDPVWWQLAPEPAQRRWALKHIKLNGDA